MIVMSCLARDGHQVELWVNQKEDQERIHKLDSTRFKLCIAKKVDYMIDEERKAMNDCSHCVILTQHTNAQHNVIPILILIELKLM